MRNYTIGRASAISGVKVPTIRYYEDIGLLTPAGRTDSNRRTYGEDEVRRLAFIRHARELGFELDAIRTLLALQDDPAQPCEGADRIARERLLEVRAKIAGLQALAAELERMVQPGSHDAVGNCRVIEVLADHGECRFHDH